MDVKPCRTGVQFPAPPPTALIPSGVGFDQLSGMRTTVKTRRMSAVDGGDIGSTGAIGRVACRLGLTVIGHRTKV